MSSALGFLSAICQRQHYSEYFQNEAILPMICENIIVKNLSLREEDIEMYNSEPFEFLKRDIEGIFNLVKQFCFNIIIYI